MRWCWSCEAQSLQCQSGCASHGYHQEKLGAIYCQQHGHRRNHAGLCQMPPSSPAKRSCHGRHLFACKLERRGSAFAFLVFWSIVTPYESSAHTYGSRLHKEDVKRSVAVTMRSSRFCVSEYTRLVALLCAVRCPMCEYDPLRLSRREAHLTGYLYTCFYVWCEKLYTYTTRWARACCPMGMLQVGEEL